MIVVVMGVAGSGKTTVGRLLAKRLAGDFLEGDDFHSPASIEKMRGGIALTDEDRAGWLTALAQEISRRRDSATPTVVSCSALRKRYRDRLRRADPRLVLVYLQGSPALLEQRLAQRQHPFMSPTLLASQLATLEPPGEDESPIVVDIALAESDIVDHISRVLRERA